MQQFRLYSQAHQATLKKCNQAVLTNKIYHNYVYFDTTCVNHVANYNFCFLLCKFWYTCLVLYAHGCICPCLHNHPARVANSDGPLSSHFQRVYVCIFAKIASWTWQTSCALNFVQFSFSKFTQTTCPDSHKFVLFCFLPLCIQATVIMLILAAGIGRGVTVSWI